MYFFAKKRIRQHISNNQKYLLTLDRFENEDKNRIDVVEDVYKTTDSALN